MYAAPANALPMTSPASSDGFDPVLANPATPPTAQSTAMLMVMWELPVGAEGDSEAIWLGQSERAVIITIDI